MAAAPAPNRWDRLAADLAAAGIPARVDSRPYTEAVRGRVRHGVSRSITLRHPAGGLVTIGDRWWNKNPDVWVGWEVCREDAEGITLGRPSRWTKKRSEVVAATRAALATRPCDKEMNPMTTMTAPAPAPDLTGPAGDPLTALAPCDAHAHTGIPAMVRLAHPRAGGLDLCKHDYETNATALAAAGWTVTDDRRSLLA